nr:immunoglobulin light chain junction region [Macaca mulatta]MPN87641.1 immunoglobulin light chain junction region [Macaca mulatta]MPN87752.1 immunoglobulin light chain junction region [Macaca mulatta]MPN88534.1 immunoglobulin light chain junction region [Macaca mulatta]MPN90080.1 immunoglobulin light chain junction region [Macaca mulatta]
CMQGIQFPLSF